MQKTETNQAIRRKHRKRKEAYFCYQKQTQIHVFAFSGTLVNTKGEHNHHEVTFLLNTTKTTAAVQTAKSEKKMKIVETKRDTSLDSART